MPSNAEAEKLTPPIVKSSVGEWNKGVDGIYRFFFRNESFVCRYAIAHDERLGLWFAHAKGDKPTVWSSGSFASGTFEEMCILIEVTAKLKGK